MNNTTVDSYLAEGCGRCDKFQTPECKVHSWAAELAALRDVLASTELTEGMKWGAPCYTVDGKNVLMLSAQVNYCAVSFFKGALLDDEAGVLVSPGKNSQSAKYFRFTSLAQVAEMRELVVSYVAEAIRRERAGEKVAFRTENEPVPDELQAVLHGDPAVAAAWEALTRGRKRSYILHVGGAKQAATRERRAAKVVPKILSGKGFNER